MGCRTRDHTLNRLPRRGRSAAYSGVSQSHAGSTASDEEIQRLTPKERHERQTKKYRQLIGITDEVVNSARKVLQQARKAHGKNLVANLTIAELRKEIAHYCELGDSVIDQTRRRVLQGEQVPTPKRSIPSLRPTLI